MRRLNQDGVYVGEKKYVGKASVSLQGNLAKQETFKALYRKYTPFSGHMLLNKCVYVCVCVCALGTSELSLSLSLSRIAKEEMLLQKKVFSLCFTVCYACIAIRFVKS